MQSDNATGPYLHAGELGDRPRAGEAQDDVVRVDVHAEAAAVRRLDLPGGGDRGVRSAQKMRVGPRILAGVQL